MRQGLRGAVTAREFEVLNGKHIHIYAGVITSVIGAPTTPFISDRNLVVFYVHILLWSSYIAA